MPKYKFRNIYKTLLQIWLFYYFLNTIKVSECQQLNDVEFIRQQEDEPHEEVSEINRDLSDNEFGYEPIDINQHNSDHNFNIDDIDDRKNVNLNVNNNLHDGEVPQDVGDVPTYTEIHEDRISGEKILYASDSPFLLRQDLQVLDSARLIIEPGVTVHFAPMVGITVHGQIQAIVSNSNAVSHDSRVTLCVSPNFHSAILSELAIKVQTPKQVPSLSSVL